MHLALVRSTAVWYTQLYLRGICTRHKRCARSLLPLLLVLLLLPSAAVVV
jgi:hypothetical protein